MAQAALWLDAIITFMLTNAGTKFALYAWFWHIALTVLENEQLYS